MPTHASEQLGVLRRPAAVAALVAGVAALVAAASPWLVAWRLVARVDVAGTSEEQVVASLRGADVTTLVWLATAAGVVAALAACSVALDLPLPRPAALAGTGAVLLAAVGLAVVVLRPVGPAGFSALTRVVDLEAGLGSLPTGVGIDLVVRAGPVPWVLLVCPAVLVLGTVAALRRG